MNRGIGDVAGAPVRPIGALVAQAQRLDEILNNIEGVGNRFYTVSERLLTPRPQGVDSAQKNANVGQGASLEARMQLLIEKAERLHISLNNIADTLDSAA